MNKFKKASVLTIVAIAVFGTTIFASTGRVYNTSQGLVLRGAASKTGEPLATIPNDAEVEIVEKLDEWYKVKVNGREGYLFAEYVKVEETVEENSPVEEQPVDDLPVDNVEPNTTKNETKIYTLPVITSSTIAIIPANTELNIEKTLNNWAYISYGNIKGWIRTYNYNVESAPTDEPENPTPDVTPEETPEPTPEVQPEEPVMQPEPEVPAENTNLSFSRGYINASSVNVRKEPTTNSDVITILILNTGVGITAQTEEWYKVTYGDYVGYIHKSLISETPTVSNRGNESRQPEIVEEEVPAIDNNQTETDTTEKEEPVEPVQPTLPSTPSAGENIVSFAKQYLGYRYVYGGTTPSSGFDCSGFVYYVYKSCGYSISRSLTVQAKAGTAVSKSELKAGDVIFFDNTSNGSLGHVGIYIGNGTFIHAANPKRGVVTDTINSGYYNTYYHSARRIVN